MESFFVRYRNHLVLLVVLVAQIVGLAMQVRHTESGRNNLDQSDSRGVRLIRYWAESIVAPPQRMIHDAKLGIANVWFGYFDLHRVRQQNQDLQKTIDRMRMEQAELLEDAHEGQRLQALLGFQQQYMYSAVLAQVFGSSGTDQSKVFYIDKGSADGLKHDMPVISPDGIVGKVREVFPHMSQVLAINDETSGAGVIFETTRLRGILKGNALGQLEVVGLMSDLRIKPGERVLTAGGDQIFPRGLPVGTVLKVTPDPDHDSFVAVILTPAAHLNQLDEVVVITSLEPRFPQQEQQDMATSEDLKGAEAAAIKDQEKASEIMAQRLPGLTTPQTPAANGQQPNGQAAPVPTPPPEPKLLPPMHSDRFSPVSSPPPERKPKSTPAAGANGAAPKPAGSSPASAKPKPLPPAKPVTKSQPGAPAGAGRTQ